MQSTSEHAEQPTQWARAPLQAELLADGMGQDRQDDQDHQSDDAGPMARPALRDDLR